MNKTATATIAPSTPILLSKKGMKELQKKISQLEHDRHTMIRGLHDIDKTNGHDDRLERVERLAQLEAVETELTEKRQTLADAKLIPSRSARMQVAIGSVVDLIDQQGRLFRYTIVDTFEADPSDGRISAVSPLGKSLLGKTANDTVHWSASSRTNSLQLVRVA